MGKVYEGNVELFANHKTKKVSIRPNPEGKFNKENVSELYNKMKEHATRLKYEMNLFVPDANKAEVPVLLASLRFGGKPYLAMLDKRDTTAPSRKSDIEVLS
tara:strand:- start:208 stop:513 length:306 start_codon:yes stop_codon:yes gene_type:complete